MGSVIAGNMKNCPSFSDYFTKGYIVPMWTDSYLYFNSETNDWKWTTSDDKFSWQYHSNHQYKLTYFLDS